MSGKIITYLVQAATRIQNDFNGRAFWCRGFILGLFFAVESKEHDNADGALWALEPVLLGHHPRGKSGVYIRGSKDFSFLFAAAFNKE